MSIEGEWNGVYRYAEPGPGSEDCPFTAQIRCVGRNILGTVVEHRERVKVTPYRLVFEVFRESLTPKELCEAEEFLRKHPDAALRSELPVEAEIDGEIRLSHIWFVKRYFGSEKTSWLLGEEEIDDHEWPDHKVWYDGRLSLDGDVIEGFWTIRPPGILGQWQEPLRTGTFRMEKSTKVV